MRKLSGARKARTGSIEARDNGVLPNVQEADAKGESAVGGAPEERPGQWFEAGHWWHDEPVEVPAQERAPEVQPSPVQGEHGEVRARVEVYVPGLKTESELNKREHWRKAHARKTAQKEAVAWALRPMLAIAPRELHKAVLLRSPLRVIITRFSPAPMQRTINGRIVDMPDSDNLISSQKYVRDTIAKELGIDDGDPRVEWVVERARGPWNVRIQIEVKP